MDKHGLQEVESTLLKIEKKRAVARLPAKLKLRVLLWLYVHDDELTVTWLRIKQIDLNVFFFLVYLCNKHMHMT